MLLTISFEAFYDNLTIRPGENRASSAIRDMEQESRSPITPPTSPVANPEAHCMICMIPYGEIWIDDDMNLTAPEHRIEFDGCSRSFGSVCLPKWLSSRLKPTCPLCRQENVKFA